MLFTAHAQAETRTLKLYFTHTQERGEITYKRNGRYIKSGLDQINHLLRDWRRNEPTNMDPRLLDLVWEVYKESGSRDYIHVVSAYRSPQTNAMLRSRSSGVAEKSQHMLGKAMDFYIPDVKISRLRDIALRKEGGGVGYYPRSGSPFVHLDVGNVRHWPRVSRKELASIFPDGKTMHIPSDGKPMPGYKQALASYEARKRNGSSIQVADERSTRGRGILSALFGGGADEAEDNAEIQVAAPAARRPAQPVAQPQRTQPAPAQPAEPETLIAALPAREVPVPRTAPRPDLNVGTSLLVASASEGREQAALATAEPASIQPQADNSPASQMLAAIAEVPLPTRRPSHAPAEAEIELAAATTTALPSSAYVMPSRRPEQPATADAIAALIAEEREAADTDEPAIAAAYLPVPGGRANALNGVTMPGAASDEASAALTRNVIAKADALDVSKASAAASPRVAMLEEMGAAARDLGGVKTTPKAPRVDASKTGGTPQPQVMPVRTVTSDVALSQESILYQTAVTRAPAFSKELAEAPTAVYTDGFQKGGQIPDPRRFTGKAVVFLSLAKFE